MFNYTPGTKSNACKKHSIICKAGTNLRRLETLQLSVENFQAQTKSSLTELVVAVWYTE